MQSTKELFSLIMINNNIGFAPPSKFASIVDHILPVSYFVADSCQYCGVKLSIQLLAK